MGIANSKRLVEIAAIGKEKDAIRLLDNAYLIDPNYTNIDGDSALHLACSNNMIELTAKLLSFNVESDQINKYSSTPLHIATRMGHDQIVRLLLKHKCDVNVATHSSYNSLTIAASCNNLSIARLLLEHKAIIQDSTLIFAALHVDGDEMTRIILNHGANVNATDEYGNTALMQACSLCHERVVKVLISREWSPRININKQNQYGWSALHFAYSADDSKERQKANIINSLLKKGANMQLNDNNGKKPKDISPQKEDDLEQPPRKKRRMEDDENNKRINRDLSEELDLYADDYNHNHNHNRNKADDDVSSEFSEDPYDNYSPPKKINNNNKRGRSKSSRSK